MASRPFVCMVIVLLAPALASANALQRVGASARGERHRAPRTREPMVSPARLERAPSSEVGDLVLTGIMRTIRRAVHGGRHRRDRPPQPAIPTPQATEPEGEPAIPTRVAAASATEPDATRSDATEDGSGSTDPPLLLMNPPELKVLDPRDGSRIELALGAGFYTDTIQSQDLELVVGRPKGVGLHARQAMLQAPYASVVRAGAMGSYHLAFFPRPPARLRPIYGLGVRSWLDGHGAIFGFDALLGCDFRVARRGVAHLLAQFGTLGRDFVLETRATLGYRHAAYEVFGGYGQTLFLALDGYGRQMVSFGGALAGLRVFR